MKKIMALDIGEKRIGIAFNQGSSIAFPWGTMRRGEDTLTSLLKLIAIWQPEEVVIGLPLRTDNSQGEEAHRVKVFAQSLAERFLGKVTLWDERFSSKEAEKRLIEGIMRRKKRRTVIDQFSAMLILQAYLDREHR